MLTSNDIRKQFIDFFVERCGHTYVPSSPVVPHEDPTLLFTNAGMNQFKDVFLAVGERPYRRAVNSQKCIRAGGKHNDLDDVGKDTYHHTFFEMLGNWSFGDYFKTEAIDWAWQLLTTVWKIDPTRLHATYFGGNEAEGLEPDDEARQLWLRYLPPERVHPGNMKDNFWEMGETGPCGPCSEIHVDRTPGKTGGSLVNGGDARVMEIWNLVFIQFNRAADGKLSPLPARHVDTGMGFERICAVIQGKDSNYDTDVFTPLFEAIRKITGAPAYGGDLLSSVDVAYRVIADHARTLSFAIADGAVPTNDGRGYVLRRILRRAVRYGRQHLNVSEPFMHKLVDVVAKEMGGTFPELKKNAAHIAQVIHEEEESFGKTLQRGIELFDQAAADAHDLAVNNFITLSGRSMSDPKSGDYLVEQGIWERSTDGTRSLRPQHDARRWPKEYRPVISGEDAFRLYDTYGFPLDLTQLMAEERGLVVDVAGFNALMEQARERSRGEGGAVDARHALLELVQQGKLPKTKFVGYEQIVAEDGQPRGVMVKREGHYEPAKSLRLGDEAAIVVDTTPFYAEAGGQVGDTGIIHSRRGAVFKVNDTIKIGDVYFHLGVLEEESIKASEPAFAPGNDSGGASASGGSGAGELLMEVNQPRRKRVMTHHTATHLMNWALREVLGEHIMQKGSLVDDEKTRFDFSHGQAMSDEQVERVQKLVAAAIAENLPVYAEEAPQEEALKIHGLRAVFGEKYPPLVRVVSIGAPVKEMLKAPEKKEWRRYSVEFCGGTHTGTTGELGRFVIVSEEGVAKGVRRILALAGEPAQRAIAHGEVLGERLEALKTQKPGSLEQDLTALSDAINTMSLPVLKRHELREQAAELQKLVKEFRKQQSRASEGQVVDSARAIAEAAGDGVIVAAVDGADAGTLRKAMDVIRAKRPDAAMLLAANTGDKIAFLASVPSPLIGKGLKAGDWVREVANVAGGSGGGKPDMAQAGGKDVSKLGEALEAARAFAKSKLG